MVATLQSLSRYEIIAKIAAGGMATVYLGAHKGPFGFEQLVAIKKLHAHLLDDPAVRESLLVEARSASRIRHANVVDVRDIEVFEDGVNLVMTYIEGASLATLLIQATRMKTKIPPRIAIRIVLDICAGLHAAHELMDDNGKPLGLVHRDVSPQNVLVGVDGIARITDFGVARDESTHRLRTNTGALKGKFAYMAPEYIYGQQPDRRIDVFALATILWEALTGRRLFKGLNDADTISRVTKLAVPKVAAVVPELGEGIDELLEMSLSKDPDARFDTAQALGLALETVAKKTNMIASPAELGAYVREMARSELEKLQQLRHAYARNSGSNGAHSQVQDTSMNSSPKMSAANALPSTLSPSEQLAQEVREDTRVAPASYGKQVSAMMGDNEPEAQISHSPAREVAPTLRTPASAHVAEPSPSVEIVSAPPVPPKSSNIKPQTSKRIGPLGTTVLGPMTPMRDIVFRKAPGISKALDGIHARAVMDGGRHASSMLATLPLGTHAEVLTVLPFQTNPPISSRRIRSRWLLAAGLLVVVSLFAAALLWGPTLRHAFVDTTTHS